MNQPPQTEPFILKIPPSLLIRSFYGWVLIVAFINWYPVVSGIFAAFLLLNLLLLKAQRSQWERIIQQDQRYTGTVNHVENPRPLLPYLTLNFAIVLLIGWGIGYFLDGRVGWTSTQWFLMISGYWLLEQSFLLFWTPTKYILTDEGLWILHHISKIFIRYGQISRVRLLDNYKSPIGQGYMIIPIKYAQALHLMPVDRSGFTTWNKQIILTPKDAKAFLGWFPQRFKNGITADNAS